MEADKTDKTDKRPASVAEMDLCTGPLTRDYIGSSPIGCTI